MTDAKVECGVCEKTFDCPFDITQRDGSTFDCPHCNALILGMDDGSTVDFHAHLHETSEGLWPKDGEGTQFIDVEPKGVWTDDDIDNEIEIVIEGVKMRDEIIEAWLPDGQRIIGPKLKCAHIFARFSMLPAMYAASEATRDALRQMEDDD